MQKRARLSKFDRVGVAVVSFLGACIGLLVSLATDLQMNLVAVLLFPGLLAAAIVAPSLGITAGAVACSVSNGAVYGLLLYGWCRLASALGKRNRR